MGRIQRTGAWLSVIPSTVNDTELGSRYWRDSLFLCYGINPTDLLDHYDSFGSAFAICHALDCNKGGLITAHHNELRDGVANLSGKAFTPANMFDDTKIFRGHAMRGGRPNPNAKARGKRMALPLKILVSSNM